LNTRTAAVALPLDPEEPQALEAQSDAASIFERLARDPNASVEKIERLMALWERSEARKAEGAFNTAMSAAQALMRPVSADASNPQTRSRYASYGALDLKLRPIYTGAGFGLSFDTGEAPQLEYVRVLCYVTHSGGHARTYHVDMPADGKGAKGGDVMTKTHAVGSAMSYGMRYLLKMIFNVAVGEDDDDGNRAGGRVEQAVRPDGPAPAGFQAWLGVLEGVAGNGMGALTQAWNESKVEYRNHLMATSRQTWTDLKAKAAAVKAVAK
jgi:hypothetical protein